MTPVCMPKANENMTEATLNQWLVQEGQVVSKEQGLCEIITDKASFALPAPADGPVLKILSPERAVLPVGFVLCVLGVPGEDCSAFTAQNDALLAAHRQAVTAIASPQPAASPDTPLGSATRATPAARRLAKEHGLDLAAVARQLNVMGPVSEKDVRAFLDRQAK